MRSGRFVLGLSCAFCIAVLGFAGVAFSQGSNVKSSAEAEARAEKTLARYRQLEARQGGRLRGEIQLARWCEQNGLVEQSRAHWIQALCLDQRSKRALKALDLEVLFKPSDDDKQTARLQREALEMLGQWDDPRPNWVLVWHAVNSSQSVVPDPPSRRLGISSKLQSRCTQMNMEGNDR